MENQKKKVNQILARNLIISSIIWAVVIIACSYSSNKEITNILIAGAFVELIRIFSSNKEIKKMNIQEKN